jgi:WD40 repeat protein
MTRRSECAGSADDSRHLKTLAGNVFRVTALVVGADGNMFSGSVDSAVRVWNSDNGSHLHTMRGNVNTVVRRTLALGRDVTLYSGGGGSLFSIKFVLKFGSARC